MGLNGGGDRGDLFVKFDVKFPDKCDPQLKDKLKPLLGESKGWFPSSWFGGNSTTPRESIALSAKRISNVDVKEIEKILQENQQRERTGRGTRHESECRTM